MNARTRTRLAAGLAALALAAAAGCTRTPPPHPQATIAAQPVRTVVRTATTTQYASALNGPLTGLVSTWQSWQDDGCDLDDSSFACILIPQTLGIEGQTIDITIQASEKTDAPGFIGQPPAELAALVQRTQQAAQAVAADLADPEHPVDGWRSDVLSMASIVDAWGPYGVG